MKKLLLVVCVTIGSVIYAQQGKVKITDAETGITYFTDQIAQESNGSVKANFKMQAIVPGGGVEIAMIMAGGGNPQGSGPAAINGRLKVIYGPAERGELDDFEGNSQGFAKLCKNTNSWPCMILWIKKEQI